MTDDRQIRDLPLDVIPQAPRRPALGADRIKCDRGAEQVREIVGHSGVGDRHPKLDGAADGVGTQVGGSVQNGS